ncbi:MAG: phage coat protein [Moraxellaceae bacterium]|nr:phage coat protein [Moraxellaceae bacterium]
MKSVKEKVTGFFKKPSGKVATVASAVMLSSPAMAAGEIDVTPVVTALEGLMTPIASVGAAFLGVQVAIRGWKIVRALI